MLGFLFIGCSEPAPSAPPVPTPCQIIEAGGGKADGPLLDDAEGYLRAAREKADEGQYLLAENAVECWLGTHPSALEGLRLRARVLTQEHRFAEAVVAASALTSSASPDASDWLTLGDAQMELGENDQAAAAYQHAADKKPGILVYDRVGWLRWLEGDRVGAREMMELAVQTGSPADPEPLAWALTRLGWLNALDGRPAPELDAALGLVPDYAPALLARGRVRMFLADPQGEAIGKPEAEWPPGLAEGIADLRTLSHHFEALRTRSSYETVEMPANLDRRGAADAMAAATPGSALVAAEAELGVRHDDVTRMVHAWTLFYAKNEGWKPEAELAVARKCPEPRLIHHASIMFQDVALARQALAGGAALTAAERRELYPLIASESVPQ